MEREHIISELEGLVKFLTCPSYIKDALSLIKQLTEENERLRSAKYMLHSDGRIEPIPTIESVRADTIREMQKRLEDEDIIHNLTDGTNYYKYIPIEALDQIVKEMLEEVK